MHFIFYCPLYFICHISYMPLILCALFQLCLLPVEFPHKNHYHYSNVQQKLPDGCGAVHKACPPEHHIPDKLKFPGQWEKLIKPVHPFRQQGQGHAIAPKNKASRHKQNHPAASGPRMAAVPAKKNTNQAKTPDKKRLHHKKQNDAAVKIYIPPKAQNNVAQKIGAQPQTAVGNCPLHKIKGHALFQGQVILALQL